MPTTLFNRDWILGCCLKIHWLPKLGWRHFTQVDKHGTKWSFEAGDWVYLWLYPYWQSSVATCHSTILAHVQQTLHFGKNQPSCIQPGVTRLFSDPSGISCFLFEEKVGELTVSSTMLPARFDMKFLVLILDAILDQLVQEAAHSCINLGAYEMDEYNDRR